MIYGLSFSDLTVDDLLSVIKAVSFHFHEDWIYISHIWKSDNRAGGLFRTERRWRMDGIPLVLEFLDIFLMFLAPMYCNFTTKKDHVDE